MPRWMVAGNGGTIDCSCPNCDCSTAEECDDPRHGCRCNGNCPCNPYNSNPALVAQRDRELVAA
jgi:hypothetical protein